MLKAGGCWLGMNDRLQQHELMLDARWKSCSISSDMLPQLKEAGGRHARGFG